MGVSTTLGVFFILLGIFEYSLSDPDMYNYIQSRRDDKESFCHLTGTWGLCSPGNNCRAILESPSGTEIPHVDVPNVD